MIKKLCIFTINFAFNRQVLLNFIEDIIPKEVELFLFIPKECKGKYSSKRIKIYESEYNKYLCFLDFRNFCNKNKINRIFSMGALPQEGFIMLLASFFKKIDVIPHLVVNPYNAFKTGFNKASVKALFELLFLYPLVFFSDRFYVNSRDTTEISKKYFPFAKNKIYFLRYIVNTELLRPINKSYARKKLSLPLNKKIIIFVGRIEYAKGSDIILELAKRNRDILFLLIGQLYDKNLKKENLENILILPPKNQEVLVEYYSAADLCVFPSRTEGFPLVPREAMSCGTPSIVPNITGLNMISAALKTNLNKDEINNKIKEFFNLPEKKKKELSKKSRQSIIEECSYNICKPLYIEKLLN